ncbi:hypothetical protein WDU94_003184 [Cyamophila willieti]
MDFNQSIELERIKEEVSKFLECNNNTIENLKKFKSETLVATNINERNETVENVRKALDKVENDLINSQEELFDLYVTLEDKTQAHEKPKLESNQINELMEDSNETKVINEDGKQITNMNVDKNKEMRNILMKELQKNHNEIQYDGVTNHKKVYKRKLKDDEREIDKIIQQLEESVYEQIENHTDKIKKVENIQQIVENLESHFNEKMRNTKIRSEKIENMMNERLKEIDKEMKSKDEMYRRQNETMSDFFVKLKVILSKLDLDSEWTLTDPCNHRMNAIQCARTIQQISSRIDLRNELIIRLKEEILTKEESISVEQEKYFKLLEKIKLVVIALTNAKMASRGLEKEIGKLKITFKGINGVKMVDSDVSESMLEELLTYSQELNDNGSLEETHIDTARTNRAKVRHDSKVNSDLDTKNIVHHGTEKLLSLDKEIKNKDELQRFENGLMNIKHEVCQNTNEIFGPNTAKILLNTEGKVRYDLQLTSRETIPNQNKIRGDLQEIDGIVNKYQTITKKIKLALPNGEETTQQEKSRHIGHHDIGESKRKNDPQIKETEGKVNPFESITKKQVTDIQENNLHPATDTEALRSELRQIRKNYELERKLVEKHWKKQSHIRTNGAEKRDKEYEEILVELESTV